MILDCLFTKNYRKISNYLNLDFDEKNIIKALIISSDMENKNSFARIMKTCRNYTGIEQNNIFKKRYDMASKYLIFCSIKINNYYLICKLNDKLKIYDKPKTLLFTLSSIFKTFDLNLLSHMIKMWDLTKYSVAYNTFHDKEMKLNKREFIVYYLIQSIGVTKLPVSIIYDFLDKYLLPTDELYVFSDNFKRTVMSDIEKTSSYTQSNNYNEDKKNRIQAIVMQYCDI
jgi:hypothetical protein